MATIKRLISVLAYAIALCGIVPLFPWLGNLPRFLLAVGMAAGIWQDLRGEWAIKSWILNASVVPVFLFYAAQFNRNNAVQPVVSVLAILLAVRLLGAKSGRHYLQIHALSLFCLASSSLFDLSPLFLVYLAMMLFLTAVSLVLLTFQDHGRSMQISRPDLHKILAAGIAIPAVSLPVLVFFFPLLPRTQIPLWNFIGAPASQVVGYTDKVEPGTASAIGESAAVVFRAEMRRVPQQALYWRGSVFNRIDGNRWIRDNAVPQEMISYGADRISQMIFLEPRDVRAAFALDAPVSVAAPRAKRTIDGFFEMPPSGRRQAYASESAVGGVLPVKPGIDRAFYLRLPDHLPPRVRTLADLIHRAGNSDATRLEQLEQYFRNGGYRYATQGLPTGEHVLEKFLFETKVGHCEFFASAFAVVLRGAGVPARLVGGYLGGDYNELGGYYLVTEQMAHVWVEAFIQGKGWVRVDPSSLAGNAGAVWGSKPQRSLGARLRMAFDSFDHIWNRSVITYDFDRQIELARSAGKRLQSLNVEQVARMLVRPFLLLVVIALVLLIIVKRDRLRFVPEKYLLQKFYRCVERDCGVLVPRQGEGLFELAEKTGNERVRRFVAVYAGALYRDRPLADDERRMLKRMLKEGFAPRDKTA